MRNTGACCDPTSGQLCTGSPAPIACCSCGTNACLCPTEPGPPTPPPGPGPSPGPTPTPGRGSEYMSFLLQNRCCRPESYPASDCRCSRHNFHLPGATCTTHHAADAFESGRWPSGLPKSFNVPPTYYDSIPAELRPKGDPSRTMVVPQVLHSPPPPTSPWPVRPLRHPPRKSHTTYTSRRLGQRQRTDGWLCASISGHEPSRQRVLRSAEMRLSTAPYLTRTLSRSTLPLACVHPMPRSDRTVRA